jgi:transposase-like protein
MGKHLNEITKQNLVKRYQKGESVSTLCSELGIPKSTFYSWVTLYSTTVTDTGRHSHPRDFDAQKKRIDKLEGIIAVLKSSNCTIFFVT